MAQYKNIFLVTILCFFVTSISAQQYTPMTAAGYQMKRIKADSTLHIPSFCGVPTLRNSTAKDGAIAMDTCNNKLYKWTNQAGWSEITGGGTTIDTTSLSNRINLKLNISDTSNMLNPYLRKTDTSSNWVNNITRTSGKDSIIYFIGGTRYAIKDSVGGGSSQNGRFGNDTATIVMAKVHNDAGVQLTNGKVVRWSSSGTNSDAPSVRLANSKADSSSANTIGFVTGTINVNDTGWVILSGKIEKLNTSAFSNGDIIYLDTISGSWTKSKPSGPIHLVYLGVVIKANAGNGSIFVKCQNGYEMDEIHDVKITTPLNNQVIAYSDTQSLWKNRDIYSIVDTTNKIATKYRADTSRSNIYLSLNGKVNISDTGTMLTNYVRGTGSSNRLALWNGTRSLTSSSNITSDPSIPNILVSTTGMRSYITSVSIGHQGTGTGVDAYAQLNTDASNIPRVFVHDGGNSQESILYGNKLSFTTTSSGTLSIQAPSPINNNRTINIPDNSGTLMLLGDTSSLSNRINAKVGGSGTTGSLTKFSGTSTVQNATADVDYMQQSDIAYAYQLMGSTIKGTNLVCPNPAQATLTTISLVSGVIILNAYYIPKSITLTGCKWFQSTNGSYTANNYNGVGLYQQSGGQLTLIASSTNDGTIWQSGVGWRSKAFTNQVSVSQGVYYVALLYSQSAQTTAPQILGTTTSAAAFVGFSTMDFTNNERIYSSLSAQTSLPSPSALSGWGNGNSNRNVIYLY